MLNHPIAQPLKPPELLALSDGAHPVSAERVARELVEEGDAGMDAIARRVGFGDTERMRRAFIRIYGQPPQALRRGAPA